VVVAPSRVGQQQLLRTAGALSARALVRTQAAACRTTGGIGFGLKG
jgi:hypothetical protein